MSLFVCNYNNMLFGYDYYSTCLETIEPDKVLYVVDTDDWKVDKIKCSDLKNVWSNSLDFVNIALDNNSNELYFVEDNIDFMEYAYNSDSAFCMLNQDYSISFKDSSIEIDTLGITHKVSYKRWDYNGNNDLCENFDEESWYTSILIDNKQVGIINGGHSCEGNEFNISYAFRTKKYFVIRLVRLIDGEPTSVTLVIRGSTIVDIYSSGANADLFELKNFKPTDTTFQTKSKIKGEPY